MAEGDILGNSTGRVFELELERTVAGLAHVDAARRQRRARWIELFRAGECA